jgi:hypothetical protein
LNRIQIIDQAGSGTAERFAARFAAIFKMVVKNLSVSLPLAILLFFVA